MSAANNVEVMVAGAPGIAAALEATGRFSRVTSAATTTELRDQLAHLGNADPRYLVFLFSDLTPVDTPGLDLVTILSRLASGGWKTCVLEVGAHARQIVATNPAAGLAAPPFTANNLLGTVAGMVGFLLEPVSEEWAYAALDPQAAHPVGPASVAAPASSEGWIPAGDTQPAASPEPPAPVVAPAPAPAPTQPVETVAPAAGSPWPTPPGVSPQAAAADPASAAGPATDPAPAPPATPAFDDFWPTPPGAGTQPVTAAPEPPPEPAPTPAAEPLAAPEPAQTGFQPRNPEPEPAPAPAAEPLAAPTVDSTWPTPGAVDTQLTQPAGHTPPPLVAPEPAQTGFQPRNPTPDPAVTHPPANSPQPHAVDPSLMGAPSPGATNPYGAPLYQQSSEPLPGTADPYGGNPHPGYGDAGQAGWAPAPLGAPGGYGQPMPHTPQRRGMVIPISVAKGGAGKSSLTLNIAVFMALRLREEGRTVCVVDANFQQADISNLINTYTPSIVDLARNPADIAPETIKRHMVHVDTLNTSFLLGPPVTSEANPAWVTPSLYTAAVDALRPLYDYIFIDTPVAEFHHNLFSEFILPSADFLVVPVNPDVTTIQNTDRWLKAITEPVHSGGQGAGYDRNRLGIVLNKASDEVSCSEDQVRVELANWHYLGAVPDSKEWQRAANEEEIIATRNVPSLVRAFSEILFVVTSEERLRDLSAMQQADSGMLGRLFGKLGRKKGG